MLKIIKWFLKSWLKDTRKYQKVKASLQSEANQQIPSHRNLCPFCQQLIRTTPYGRQIKGKRKGVAINQIASQMRDAKLSHKRQLNHLIQMKQNILDRFTQKQIQSRKQISDFGDMDILNRKHIALKLEISNNQTVLQQVLNQFSMKTQAMARFVTNTQASCIQDFKMNQQSDYVQFQQQMRLSITEKYNQAKQKLKNLMIQKMIDNQKLRKDKLINRQVQTGSLEYTDKQKHESKIKQLTSTCQRLKNELQSQKALNQNLKQLLQSKSIQFEKQFLNFRRQVIKSDIKSKHYLKSLKSFKSGMQDIDQDEGQQKQQTASIKLQQSNDGALLKRQFNKIVSGNLKQKQKYRNRYSIKFTVQDGDNKLLKQQSIKPEISNIIQRIQVFVQTQPICIIDGSTCEDTFHFERSKQKDKKILNKQFRNIKVISQKSLNKKSSINLYAHVKSKVYHMLQKQSIKSVRKDFKQSRSSCMGQMVKKLSVDYLYPTKKQPTKTQIKLYKITQQPIYIHIISYYIGKQDIFNLFINDKNAHNYQCLIYRNSLFNLANVNQKRIINLSKQVQSSDIQWISKRQSAVNDTLENKIIYAYYHQLNNFKKRDKQVYDQIKRLMRSPYELSKKVDIIQLQSTQTPSKDIEIGELKRMLNIILKFHCDCIGEEKDSICEHLFNFSQKIGIKFI